MGEETRDSYESSHESSIQSLIKEFGLARKKEIMELYDAQRKLLEENAKLDGYIPILTHKFVRSIMKGEYKPGYLEELLKRQKTS